MGDPEQERLAESGYNREITPAGILGPLKNRQLSEAGFVPVRKEELKAMRSRLQRAEGERERLLGALASALASAGFVKVSGYGPGWWRCTACGVKDKGRDAIAHEPKCPEAVYREIYSHHAQAKGERDGET